MTLCDIKPIKPTPPKKPRKPKKPIKGVVIIDTKKADKKDDN